MITVKRLYFSLFLLFFSTSAWGADYYYASWQEALSQLMINKDKFAGFEYSVIYFPGGGDCWDKFIGVPGGYYHFPNSLALLDSACISQYSDMGVVPDMSTDAVSAINALNATLIAFPDNCMVILRAFAGLAAGYLLIMGCIKG